MARTVQARLDDDSERDLALLRNEGCTDSEAIRLALREAAARRRRRSSVRAEVAALAADPVDRAEAQRIRAEWDEFAVIWDEVE